VPGWVAKLAVAVVVKTAGRKLPKQIKRRTLQSMAPSGDDQMSDPRAGAYKDLHQGQLSPQERENRQSAECILDILWEYIQPSSALDVGCGLGSWIAALQGRGVRDVRGIDGPWLSKNAVVCDPSLLQICDLESDFALGCSFDLVVCLEVAEHLSSAAAERFVASLVRHAPVILFSAAIPFQGGHHHVNEQFLSYWVTHFARHGFDLLDLFRGRIWNDQRVIWWLRQNLVLFAHKDLIMANEKLQHAIRTSHGPASIVHPDVYLSRMQMLSTQLEHYRQVERYLRQGGTFRSTITANGQINLQKVG
jgi:2-polyprenyl-3-methyl-5-hydroxy-6-metoxy-1,4-benzoquinol methylase